jgi:Lrp/AsnC family transcriptional regulator, leucine-responsive regulatory protein
MRSPTVLDHPELDDLDLHLLDALQRNARSTFAELAGAVGLGSSAVHDRVKRLEQRGYVKGYAARIDGRRLGIALIAFVSVYTTPDVQYEAFTRAVAALPEIAEIHSVAGEESFVLKVLTRSTAHLDDFLSRLKATAGIARTKTTIVLSTPFEREGFALDGLVGNGATPSGNGR